MLKTPFKSMSLSISQILVTDNGWYVFIVEAHTWNKKSWSWRKITHSLIAGKR